MRIQTLALALCASLIAPWALADEEEAHFDIFVGRPESGTQTLVGGALVPGVAAENDLNLEERIFEGDLETDFLGLNQFYSATEPGFFNAGSEVPGLLEATNPAGALPLIEDEVPLVTQIEPLRYWNGLNPIFFGSTDATLLISGFSSDASATGSLDGHPFYDIDGPTDDLPAAGIYLATLSVQLVGPDSLGGLNDLDPSEPVLVLFVTGEEFEPAVERAEAFLSGEIPEPSTALLASLVAAAAGLRKRLS